jgi:hypothetical protein
MAGDSPSVSKDKNVLLLLSAWSVPGQPRYGQIHVVSLKSLVMGYRTVISGKVGSTTLKH